MTCMTNVRHSTKDVRSEMKSLQADRPWPFLLLMLLLIAAFVHRPLYANGWKSVIVQLVKEGGWRTRLVAG